MRRTIRYLGVDYTYGIRGIYPQGLSITSHIRRVSDKCVQAFNALGRIARANWGLGHGAMRILYRGLFVPIITYGAPGWADLLNLSQRGILARTQRQALLRVTRAYRTVSTDALPALAGEIPIDLLIEERAARYFAKRHRDIALGNYDISGADLRDGTVPPESVGSVIRTSTLAAWQRQWDASVTGRITYEFFPDVARRLETTWVTIDHYVAQFLSGHGDFREKLRKHALVTDGRCDCGSIETSRHVLYDCPIHDTNRALLKKAVLDAGHSWPAESAVLVSRDIFPSFRRFTMCALKTKEVERRERRDGSQ